MVFDVLLKIQLVLRQLCMKNEPTHKVHHKKRKQHTLENIYRKCQT